VLEGKCLISRIAPSLLHSGMHSSHKKCPVVKFNMSFNVRHTRAVMAFVAKCWAKLSFLVRYEYARICTMNTLRCSKIMCPCAVATMMCRVQVCHGLSTQFQTEASPQLQYRFSLVYSTHGNMKRVKSNIIRRDTDFEIGRSAQKDIPCTKLNLLLVAVCKFMLPKPRCRIFCISSWAHIIT
jgi:hypothetical protein